MTVATLTSRNAGQEIYDIAGVRLTVTQVDPVKDTWTSEYVIPAGKNASGTIIPEKTYKLEAPATRKSARDHAAISLGRSLMSYADDVASTDSAKKKDVKILAAENVALSAKNAALEYLFDTSDVVPTPEQIGMLDENLRTKVNAKIAKNAKNAKTA